MEPTPKTQKALGSSKQQAKRRDKMKGKASLHRSAKSAENFLTEGHKGPISLNGNPSTGTMEKTQGAIHSARKALKSQGFGEHGDTLAYHAYNNVGKAASGMHFRTGDKSYENQRQSAVSDAVHDTKMMPFGSVPRDRGAHPGRRGVLGRLFGR